jgi:hypothetical protein
MLSELLQASLSPVDRKRHASKPLELKLDVKPLATASHFDQPTPKTNEPKRAKGGPKNF